MKRIAGTRTTALATVKGVITKTKNNGRTLMYLIRPRGARKADKKATNTNIGKVKTILSAPAHLPTILAKVM